MYLMMTMMNQLNHNLPFATHMKMVGKLIKLLESWNVPNDGFQQTVEWYEEARINNITFTSHNKTRNANINALHQLLPDNVSN